MKKVCFIGVGALGSNALLFSRNLDCSFRIIDFDKVESKNTFNQFHPKQSVGQNKALAFAKIQQYLFAHKIEAIPHRLTLDNEKQLLSGFDLLVDCLDNAASRAILQNFARKNKIECLHGGLSADGQFGLVQWDEKFVIDSEGAPGTPTCEDGRNYAFTGMVSCALSFSMKLFLEEGKKKNFRVFAGGMFEV